MKIPQKLYQFTNKNTQCQINKINKKIKEEIEVDSTLTKMIDINMKNAINKIINNYKQQQ